MGLFEDFKSMRDDLFNEFEDFIVENAIIKDGVSGSGYDPTTGTNTPSFSTNETLKVFLKDYSSEQISGEILAGDVLIIVNIDDLPLEISSEAIIEVGSTSYKVIRTMPKPKTNPVVIQCQCRKM